MTSERPIRRIAASMLATLAATALAAALKPAPAAASLPVVDVAALTQLRAQLEAWRSQLLGMQRQLSELHAGYVAVTGHRGMDAVLSLSSAARNYLPADWSPGASAPGAQLAALRNVAHALQDANAVLGAPEMARFPIGLRELLDASRVAVAGNEAAMRAAYARSSARFAQLDQLVRAIADTTDAKGIAELQGRIGAEQAMLANEAIKLFASAQNASADAAAIDLQRREQVVANHGAFAARFRPTPPVP